MASEPSSQKGADENIIAELIFSCSICQATVSDVYANPESNKGFLSASGGQQEDGIVTKMWIAECSHVTCSKHLEGGAAPFHPQKIEPRAACPRCKLASGDDSLKALYAIRGLGEGECDPVIPAEWRRCPPVKLDGSLPGMEAFRFQYMALAHYAGRVRIRIKEAMAQQQASEASCTKERKQRRQLQSEILDLQRGLQSLEETESKLKMWETRKPKIYHYLRIFGDMMSEIQSQRALLSNLGYQVIDKSYAFPADIVDQAEQAHERRRLVHGALNTTTSSATTAGAYEANNSSSARKRKDGPAAEDHVGRQENARGSSRNMMPPPLPRFKQPKLSHQPRQPAPAIATRINYLDEHTLEQLPFRLPPRQQQILNSIQHPSNRWKDEASSIYRHQNRPEERVYGDSQHPESSNVPQRQPAVQVQHQDLSFRAKVARPQNTGNNPRGTSQDEVYSPLAGLGQPHSQDGLTRHGNNAYHQGFGFSTTGYSMNHSRHHHAPQNLAHSPFFKRRPGDTEAHSSQYVAHDPSSRLQGASLRQALPIYGPRERTVPSFELRLSGGTEERSAHMAAHNYNDQGRREAYIPPQTPRNTQGFLQRPDQPPSRMTYAPTTSPVKTQRTRISLPLTKGRIGASSYGDRNGALSRIQGVRGLASLQNHAPGLAPQPAFGTPRRLFSAAGSRRSVRR